ncbi:helix-turn-helix transcriptional regulator [Aquimarina sp. 2201CG5-10]|uniref:helix-turn-helix domain-containing protein n=1 Tax=Aquimarina callyspongiae TaxID=3098150 RepID=UPI002AB4665A|nr:helix-turn-helix transcriptional regulator [Aquimarina sp. 2201CG5-10]MDY8137702.1 helix-turn-helix transcriptional regulator [Aquimarina sp. 2201CG5-10]
MDFQNQIIFFLSALGAFNGFLLSFYFALKTKKKKFSNYFLALLLLMLSIRIAKSVFFYFNPQLANIFIQIGLSACILIGPFLFLYLKSYTNEGKVNWKIHVIPFLAGITILGILYPYVEHRTIWSKWIVKGIYLQLLVYIVLSFKFVKPIFKKVKAKESLKNIDLWLLSIYFGNIIILLTYVIGAYTSYIAGALSFSFVLYLIILLFVFKSNKESTFFNDKEKYKNKEIDQEILKQIEHKLSMIIEKEVFLNPNLTIIDVAKEINISKHTLSQYLNEKLDKSFSTYINEFRIEKSKKLLETKNNYSIESVGYESGFNSKSTFYTTFKKLAGQTPAEYRKSKVF